MEYYLLMVIIPTIILLTYMTLLHTHLNVYHFLLFFTIVAANYGYLSIALSKTLDEALLANRICYFGGCCLPVCLFLIIVRLGNFHIPKWIRATLVFFALFVFCCALTTGYNTIYYRVANIERVNGITIFTKEYGPLHIIYPIMLYGFLIINLFLIIYALIKNHSVSYKNLIIILCLEATTIIAYSLNSLLSLQFNIIPLVFTIDSILLFLFCYRINMYDIENVISSSFDNPDAYGYIVFDNNFNYINSNSVAKRIFPEFKSLKVDFPIDATFPLYSDLCCCFKTADTQNFYSMKHNDRLYRCNTKALYNSKTKRGYIIEITDDTKQQEYINLLNNYNTELMNTVNEKTAHIKAIQKKFILDVANMVENRDDNTGGHIKRTSHVVNIIINAMKEDSYLTLSTEFCDAVIRSAPMHDLGKIAIDDQILRKPGKLTDEEFEIMKTHASKSGDIVASIFSDMEDQYFVKIAYNVARFHHEKWNGNGYPEGLSGEQIPLEARIMALADVYDALVSERCYKKPMSYDKAFEIIKDSMGQHFDPQLFKYFVICRDKLESYYESQKTIV